MILFFHTRGIPCDDSRSSRESSTERWMWKACGSSAAPEHEDFARCSDYSTNGISGMTPLPVCAAESGGAEPKPPVGFGAPKLLIKQPRNTRNDVGSYEDRRVHSPTQITSANIAAPSAFSGVLHAIGNHRDVTPWYVLPHVLERSFDEVPRNFSLIVAPLLGFKVSGQAQLNV